VSVARQIFQNVFRAFYGITHIDNPLFFIQLVFELFVFITCKRKFPTPPGMTHEVHELASKDQRQCFFVKKIVAFAGLISTGRKSLKPEFFGSYQFYF
jgi:hypothetical protein